MNLVKASTILYPILGENVSDIILSYMKLKKPKVMVKNPNMHKVFKKHGLMTSKIDDMFQYLENIYSGNHCRKEITNDEYCRIHGHNCPDVVEDCWKAYIENRDCKKCGKDCKIRYDIDLQRKILVIINIPTWISSIKYREYEWLQDRIITLNIDIDICTAFLKDLKFRQMNSPVEEKEITKFQTSDNNRSFR